MNPGATTPPNITLSVVSHGHGKLIAELFADIRQKVTSPVRVILTINRPEPEEPWADEQFPFEITVVRNSSPKGFGANHNAALAKTQSEFFCVLNPDIRLQTDPFPVLASQLADEGLSLIHI
jgi:N-acetylglucosaminyl-diphospho-decaprenol L-rhamnosyltransferase